MEMFPTHHASKSLFLMACAVVAALGYPTEHEEHYDHYPHYTFEYDVHDPHSHDVKSQKESRHGDKVDGYYMVKDADGSIREVHYSADHHSGFQAHVTKDGIPIYEDNHHQPLQAPVHDFHSHHGHHAFSSQKYYNH